MHERLREECDDAWKWRQPQLRVYLTDNPLSSMRGHRRSCKLALLVASPRRWNLLAVGTIKRYAAFARLPWPLMTLLRPQACQEERTCTTFGCRRKQACSQPLPVTRFCKSQGENPCAHSLSPNSPKPIQVDIHLLDIMQQARIAPTTSPLLH